MKKCLRWLSIVVACVIPFTLFTGCASGTQHGSLTVYYLNKPLYTDAINAFQEANPDVKLNLVSFDKASDMDLRVTTEMGAGKGADVMLFSADQTTLDTHKMAINGAFYDLSKYFEASSQTQQQDEDESSKSNKYYEGLLDSGKVGQSQYLVPLGFDLTSLYTSEENLKSQGITLGSTYTYDDLCAAIQTNIQNSENDPDHTAILNNTSGGDIASWLDTAGIDIVDLESRKVVVTEDELRGVVNLVKAVNQTSSKAKGFQKKYKTDFVNSTASITFLMYNQSFVLGAAYYNILFNMRTNQTFRLITIPESKTSADYNGDVMLYGAINASTSNPGDAYLLLKYLMNWGTTNMTFNDFGKYPTFVNPNNNSDLIASLSQKKLENGETMYPDELAGQVENILNSIHHFTIRNKAVSDILDDAFQPYLDDKAAFEDCFTNMMGKLNTYLSE